MVTIVGNTTISAEEAAKNLQVAETHIRDLRNQLLAETDWASGTDVTMTEAMRVYRQALRDIPQQAGFPNNVTWPTKP